MHFSILHVSDLHRDPSDDLKNGWLLESLERDLARCSEQMPAIPQPELCIVSGDVVFGVRPDAARAAQEIERQYAQAEEFLVGLADRLFDGDRERIVIVPGNHDVSFFDFMSCIERVDAGAVGKDKKKLVTELFSQTGRLRWSWEDLCFYRITDENRYGLRFKPFADFYARFYEKKRSFSPDPTGQFDVFDFPKLGFCLLALNSCHDNDPFRRAGTFHPDCLAAGSRSLRQSHRAGWVSGVVWHHNVGGGSLQDDYIDPQVLQVLIDSGASIAFHGHQHRDELIDERYRLGPSSRKLTVISAGTLCAGPRFLSPGMPRAYNLVELDTTTMKGRVHVRKMVNQLQDLPVWGPGHVIATGGSFVDFELCQPLLRRLPDRDLDEELKQGEQLLGRRQWEEAARVLEPLVAHREAARPLLLKALEELESVARVRASLWPPKSAIEAVAIGGLILEHGSSEDAAAFNNLSFVSDSTDASVREIARRVRERGLR